MLVRGSFCGKPYVRHLLVDSLQVPEAHSLLYAQISPSAFRLKTSPLVRLSVLPSIAEPVFTGKENGQTQHKNKNDEHFSRKLPSHATHPE
jgi:hypothetical protein